MPGQAVASGLRKLARQTCGIDTLLEFWGDGGNVKALAEGIGVTAPWLRTWFKKQARKVRDAHPDVDYYAMRAESLQEQSLEDAEEVPAERDEIQKTKLVIEQRHRIAAALDPTTWGEKQTGPLVQIASNGDLHLLAVSTAAKQLPAPRKALLPSGKEREHGPETTS